MKCTRYSALHLCNKDLHVGCHGYNAITPEKALNNVPLRREVYDQKIVNEFASNVVHYYVACNSDRVIKDWYLLQLLVTSHSVQLPPVSVNLIKNVCCTDHLPVRQQFPHDRSIPFLLLAYAPNQYPPLDFPIKCKVIASVSCLLERQTLHSFERFSSYFSSELTGRRSWLHI